MGAAAKGDAEVNLLRKTDNRGRGSSHRGSSYCGSSYRISGDCRMRDAVCYKCQRKGHMQRMCTATSGVGGATRHEQGASQASKSKSRCMLGPLFLVIPLIKSQTYYLGIEIFHIVPQAKHLLSYF